MVPILNLIEPEKYRPEFVVAIDPGKTTGVAIYSFTTKKIVTVHTVDFWIAYEQTMEIPPSMQFIIVESSKTKKKIWQGDAGTKRNAMGEIGRRIGENNAQSELLAEGFRRKGYYVMTVAPKRTKLKQEAVQLATGFEGRTNEHNRDAIMIAWAHRHPQVVKAHAETIYKQQVAA